jgi:hypothetical protein
MQEEEHLTAEQCDELAKALLEDAARLPPGSEREDLLQLAMGYHVLADMKTNGPSQSELIVARGQLCEQIRTSLCKLHIGAGLMPP